MPFQMRWHAVSTWRPVPKMHSHATSALSITVRGAGENGGKWMIPYPRLECWDVRVTTSRHPLGPGVGASTEGQVIGTCMHV
jgi:hypothetical protein